MVAEPFLGVDYESLEQTDAALAAMMTRLRAIVDGGPLTDDGLVEIAAIYNNVAYVFLYLESNEAHVNYERVAPWRDAFYKDDQLDAALLERLLALRSADGDVEQARLAYVAYLEDKRGSRDLASEMALEGLLTQAKAVVVDVQRDQAALLRRLGGLAGAASPGAAFYKLVSGIESPATRTKLSRAWTQTRDGRLDELLAAVDAMVARRRDQCAAQGAPSVLATTLARARVGEDAAWDYLAGYLTRAIESHAALEAEVLEATGAPDHAMDHFGAYVRGLQAGRDVPQFRVDECLAFISLVGARTFGLTLHEAPRTSPHVITMDVDVDGERAGQINFDLWDTGTRTRTANSTRGIRNRTEWAGIVQRPVAYVSCRFRRADDGADRITFQNAHSLFHEFGHAVNHLLIRRRLPTQSGLDYLPLERLEDLSMWFEKWVYHPDFADHLSLSDHERDGLALCREVKMLEYRRSHVERAVTAALDFDVHRRATGGLADSYRRLDEQFGVARFSTLGDFPVYFTWPMFQANPGANFAYLWGAGASAEAFTPFLETSLDDITDPERVRAMFSPCFDFDEPSATPDSAAVFEFYDQPAPARATGGTP